ncbi:MAG: cell division protein ZipA C-terminal FtsZ-binding domain-containing protein [Pseudomonadota bacterium]
MDGLRWLLLAFGVLTIVGVYFYSRREALPKDAKSNSDRRLEPTLDGEADVLQSAVPPELDVASDISSEGSSAEPPPASNGFADDAPSIEAPEPSEAPPDGHGSVQQQKIVTLRVVARDRGAFRGDELILSLRGIGMRHGKFGIFHRFEGEEEKRAIFSAASLVEPGSFDLANIKEQEIPGISLFAVLPGPVDGVQAFDLMIAAARAIAKTMDADLLDETGSTLSIQRERYMREEIIAFEHAMQVAG